MVASVVVLALVVVVATLGATVGQLLRAGAVVGAGFVPSRIGQVGRGEGAVGGVAAALVQTRLVADDLS